MSTQRRLLGDTMVDVAIGAMTAAASSGLVRVRQIVVDLPIELAIHRRGDTWELRGDVPRLITRTAFDLEPGRLAVIWVPGEAA